MKTSRVENCLVDASNLGATFTQLLRNEKSFGNQFAKFSYHLQKYTYIAELFTNVKLRADQIGPFIAQLQTTLRRIINNDVRYQQRQDNLPSAVGCRAFGVADLGGGWYSPNIKVATSSAQVLEFICRQWCKRTNQYPHTLSVVFDSVALAKKALPCNAGDLANYCKSANLDISRTANIVTEEYYLSQPFRLELYLLRSGFVSCQFGSACRVVKSEFCHFDNLNNMALNIGNFDIVINDCFAVNGTRAVQSWGHREKDSKKLPPVKKTRHFYGTNTDKRASLYYRACKAGFVTFNAYIYGRLRAGNYNPTTHIGYRQTLQDIANLE